MVRCPGPKYPRSHHGYIVRFLHVVGMIAEMQLRDKVAVVTGGATGIGEGLARRFHAEGARAVVIADIDAEGAEKVAGEIGGVAIRTDVTQEASIRHLVQETMARYGQIDLFCSNAGVFIEGDIDAPDHVWMRMRDMHLLAHVYAARAVLPKMVERGEGYLLQTVSAAGLTTSLESVTYTVTKHACLALAEWISITYGDRGIKVSALCPQGVRTNMLKHDPDSFLIEGAISVEQVADAVIQGLDEERFLILPHEEVAEHFRRKASDYDRWLRGMRRLRVAVAARRSKKVKA
jgi:NAD(P)-dependent dehydrogenase (short-subunit alcohol dehydrogenase family)